MLIKRAAERTCFKLHCACAELYCFINQAAIFREENNNTVISLSYRIKLTVSRFSFLVPSRVEEVHQALNFRHTEVREYDLVDIWRSECGAEERRESS